MTGPSGSHQAPSARVPVLFLHSATEPPLGADIWVHSLIVRFLARSKFDVHVACAVGSPDDPTPTFKVMSSIEDVHLRPVNLGRELFRRSKFQKVLGLLDGFPAFVDFVGLARYIRHNQIRVVHTSDRPRDAVASVLLARITGAKCLIHVHVAYGDWMSPLLKWAFARADALVGVSKFVAKTLVEAGYDPSKVHAVANAIDLDAWDPDLQAVGTRAELGIDPTAPVIACVARIFRPKGQLELIRALAIVRRALPAVRLLIVGQDYPAGNRHSDELRSLASELGVGSNVVFTGLRRDVASIMAASDVFAMHSVLEPFGLVYAEAMAMRRPVVALDDGGTPEVVEHGKSGLLSRAFDIDGFAAHLLRLLKDEGARGRMGRSGRERVEREFHGRRLAADVGAIYEQLVGRRRSASSS